MAKVGSLLGTVVGAVCVALPFWFARGAQDAADPSQERKPARPSRDSRGDDRRGDDRFDEKLDAGPALARFEGPTRAAALVLEDAVSERGDPLLVARPDGGAWLITVEYELGVGDRFAIRSLGPDGALPTPVKPPLVVPVPPAPPRAIVRPVATQDDAGRLVLLWTEAVAGVAQLHAAVGGFGSIVALTGGSLPNRNPELARAADGSLFVVWERWVARGERGSFDIAFAPLHGTTLGEPRIVAEGVGSELDPVVAATADGLAIAWSSYRGRDYEIALRRLDPRTGALAGVVEVSSDSQSDDLHPTLAATPDGSLWLAWDRFEDSSRGRSAPAELEGGDSKRAAARAAVRVVCIRGDAVTLPPAFERDGVLGAPGFAGGAPLLSFSGALPRLIARRDGSLALLWRFLTRQGPGGKAYGFPLLVSAIGGQGIAPPIMLEGSAGGPEEAAGCELADGALLLAWQQDHRLEVETGTLLRPLTNEAFQKMARTGVVVTGALGPSAIGVARIERSQVAAAATTFSDRAPSLEPPHAHPAAADLDDPIVNGSEHALFEADGKSYRVYWGDLHRHSSASRCTRGFEPAAADRYVFGRDTALFDFMALTDHSCHVDPVGWWRLDKAAETAGDPGFVALCGFEWSTGLYGHQNVILRGTLRPFLSNTYAGCGTLERLYSMLKPETALAIPHHTADVARRTDFAQCDPRFVKLVEIYQAQRGSYEFDGCLRQSHLAHAQGSFATDALARGRKVGFIASTDHGEGVAYAAVLAEKLERGALFDALRARRTFGATAKGMVIDLRVDGHLMGEEFVAHADPRVTVKARGTRELCELIVFRDGAPWQVVGRAPAGSAAPPTTELTLQLELTPPKAARDLDWRVTVAAPVETGVTMKPWFELPGYARDDLGPDRPQWRVKEGTASWLWKKSYANLWEPSHSRLRLSGPRDARLTIEARAVGEGAAAAVATGTAAAPTQRDIALGELLRSPIAGDSPLGPWQLTASESFDAAINLARTLGTRELAQEWRDDALAPGDHWYYARIVQADGEIAWSSPLFVTRK